MMLWIAEKSKAYISMQPCWDISHGFVQSDMKVILNVSTGRRVRARQCSARFLATWTATDQRAEQGSCTLLNINAGENKCDPLLSSPDLSLSLSLPGILLPALPAASTLKHPRAVAAEQEESQSKILGPPSSLCFPLPVTLPVVSLLSDTKLQQATMSRNVCKREYKSM